MKKNLRSEAAIKEAMKNFDKIFVELSREGFACLVTFSDWWGDPVAEIDLRDFVKKRAALTGIKKEFASIVRGKPKTKRKKK